MQQDCTVYGFFVDQASGAWLTDHRDKISSQIAQFQFSVQLYCPAL
jgi:hypothetical protein